MAVNKLFLYPCELVRVCRKRSFPAEYALAIKCTILNSYANINLRGINGGDQYIFKPEEEAVQYCYNSLYGNNSEEAVAARKRFLTEIIKAASSPYSRWYDPLYHPGPTYQKICESWRKTKFEEYIVQEKVDFKKLVEVLKSSFTEVIKNAELNGEFEETRKRIKKT